MSLPRAVFFLSAVLICSGCRTAKEVAVTSFRVIDTPARYVRNRIDPEPSTTTTTTTTTQSDVANPGYPVVAATRSPTPVRPRSTTQTPPGTASRQPSRPPTSPPARQTPKATPHPQVAAARQFPTARPVPGKPGYVYSIDPNGGLVDVTGYKSGDKAKDPYTQQIFVVP